MEQQKVIFSENLRQTLEQAVSESAHDRLLVLVDETTRDCCLPVIRDYDCMKEAQVITIQATDTHKTLESLAHVWSEMQRMGATRHSLMINLGGGMVTDLGGFAASTFKRGISFINIPTTLLSMVDASVGGKTGINFGGLKNEIGVFNNAHCVILDTTFLRTLDQENILSGYAEMIKHGLISDEKTWAELMNQSSELRVESLEFAAALEKCRRETAHRHGRPYRERYPQGSEPRAYGRTRLRVVRIGAPPYPPRLCGRLRSGGRALSLLHQDRFPAGQDAPDHQLHQGALRTHDHHL